MPLYDYRCRACSKVTEVRHGFREAYDAPCPACGGTLARVFNPAGIVFKGSGFYVTDSRKPTSEGSSAKSDAPAASGGNAAAKSADTAGTSGTTGAKPGDAATKSSDSAAKPATKTESSAA